MEQIVLSVDIGTSSLKAAFVSETGAIVAFARRQFLLCNTQHASKEWLPALQNAIHELIQKASSNKIEVCGICVSGNGPTLVAQTGETFLWNENVVQGNTNSLFIPRILAFKNKFPNIWTKSTFIYSGPEYFLWLLTGDSCTILPEANFKSAYWSNEELLSAGLSKDECEKLPPFVNSGFRLSGLTQRASSFLGGEEVGIVSGIPVFCGAPDFIAALVGTATTESGILCDRAGSSEGLNFCTKEPLDNEKIRTLPSIIPALWNASVLLPDSGSKFDSFKQKIEREQGSQIEYNELVQSLIYSDGSNASFDQGKYLMIQTALNLKDAIAILKKAANEKQIDFPTEMRVTGGQAKNDLWNQMKADITGMKIIIPSCEDAELLGDAAFAFTTMKLYSNLQAAAKSLFKEKKVFIPNQNNQDEALFNSKNN